MDSIDLSVRLGPLTLANPFIVGSGPTVRTVDQVKAAEDSGWAAVCPKLTIDPAPYLTLPPRYRWLRKNKLHIFTAERRMTPPEGLRLCEEARKATHGILIMPNITYDGEDYEGGADCRIRGRGAHAIETTCAAGLQPVYGGGLKYRVAWSDWWAEGRSSWSPPRP
jgi:hypothetical protein